ncbi:hypothetical protein DAI22_11g237800 [Oryza sativa Japonica Group]|nr:hypothetical protein DAI22_11g237800 [Oryza sativa Japonica Group]KAF2912196.1 hypothetical protein DAI22_11g237800 [Oryza sativa Japonica Group]
MKFHAGGRPDCSLALKSWTKFPEAAVDGGQRPALKRLVDEVEKVLDFFSSQFDLVACRLYSGCDAVSGGARLLGRFELGLHESSKVLWIILCEHGPAADIKKLFRISTDAI